MSNDTIIAARAANRLCAVVRSYAKAIEAGSQSWLKAQAAEYMAIRAMELAKDIVAIHPRYKERP